MRRTVPARRWQRLLGETVPVTSIRVSDNQATGIEAGVGRAVQRAGRRLPWHSTCLDQAIAAQLMLRWRGRPGVAVIGLRPGTSGASWPAHAWLIGSTGTVVGLDPDAEYTPVSGFRPTGRGRR